MCQQTDSIPMGNHGHWVATLAIVVAVIVISPSSATAYSVGRMDERLPAPVGMTCAVSTGIVVYVFGGATKGALLDTIYAVDLETGRTSVLPYTLPSPRKLASAVWTGKEAYIIGGIGYDAEPIPEIVRFVPGVGIEVVEGAMPYGTKGIPSVWSGEAIYVLGNCLSSEKGQHDVIRFDPVNKTTEILEDELPIPGAGSAAVWADGGAYIVGGRQNLTILSDRIIRYVPGEGAQFLDARLPQGRIGAACAWNGETVFAFGGTIALECGPLECVPTDYLDEIVEFDPINDTCRTSVLSLPRPMDLRAAVYVELGEVSLSERILIPGGLTATGPVDWLTVVDFDQVQTPREHDNVLTMVTAWLRDNLRMVATVGFMVVIAVATFGLLQRQRKTDEELVL